MKHYALLLITIVSALSAFSQNRYFTKNGGITFHAGTAMEDIDAINNSATSVFDATTGQIEYAVLIKGFEFKRALMQDHFNENYLESDKFPKSIFKGKISNISELNIEKEGSYAVNVKGSLEIHGIKREIEIPATITVKGKGITAISDFTVLLSDYNISIPGLVKDKIAKTVTIKVKCNYSPLQ